MKTNLAKRTLAILMTLVMVLGMGAMSLVASEATPTTTFYFGPGGESGNQFDTSNVNVRLTIHHWLPVDGAVLPEGGSITGTPTPIPDGWIPMVGEPWSIRRVTNPEALIGWDGSLPYPTGIDLTDPPITVDTDAYGRAIFDYSEGLVEGIWLVTAPPSAHVTHPDPFFVSVPTWLPSGPGDDEGDWIYDIHVYPKESDDPPFEKEVNQAWHEGGEMRVEWQFSVGIARELVAPHPSGTGLADLGYVYWTNQFQYPIAPRVTVDGVYVRVTDQLDPRLTYVEDSLEIFVLDADGVRHNLTISTDVAFSENNGLLLIDILAPGRALIAQHAAPGSNIYIVFETIVNPLCDGYCGRDDDGNPDTYCPELALGDIYNDGTVNQGPDSEVGIHPDDRPYVRANRLLVIKTGTNDVLLPDADFYLFHRGAFTQSAIDRDPDADWTALPGFAGRGTSDEYGEISFSPLTSGTFILVERNAPEGYRLLLDLMEVEISEALTFPYTVTVTVRNTRDFDLPMTGGAGTIAFTIAGLTLIGGSIFMLLVVVKRRKAETAA